jgi:hypothetical protein
MWVSMYVGLVIRRFWLRVQYRNLNGRFSNIYAEGYRQGRISSCSTCFYTMSQLASRRMLARNRQVETSQSKNCLGCCLNNRKQRVHRYTSFTRFVGVVSFSFHQRENCGPLLIYLSKKNRTAVTASADMAKHVIGSSFTRFVGPTP